MAQGNRDPAGLEGGIMIGDIRGNEARTLRTNMGGTTMEARKTEERAEAGDEKNDETKGSTMEKADAGGGANPGADGALESDVWGGYWIGTEDAGQAVYVPMRAGGQDGHPLDGLLMCIEGRYEGSPCLAMLVRPDINSEWQDGWIYGPMPTVAEAAALRAKRLGGANEAQRGILSGYAARREAIVNHLRSTKAKPAATEEGVQ